MDFERGGVHLFERPGSDIRMKGYLKKLKTMKKKFFVLRSTSSSGPARLEYYDSEKKFNANHHTKRSIHLHTCFNINRKSDSRHKYAIALYTKEDCFSVICEDEKEQETWLSLMLDYQNEYVRDGDRGREHYEHVWQITVQPKGLGQTKALRGPCRLCLTSHNICFIKLNSEQPQFIFQLETVRSLAHSDNLFRMEVGKIAPTGEGELWMQTDDNVIAQNLHETILSYMKNMDSTHFSSSTLPRSEFRHRTASESHTLGSCQKIKPRPMSVCHGIITSPGTSPSLSDFGGIPVPHRTRSDSNESKASRRSTSAMDGSLDTHQNITPLEEESDSEGSVSRDLSNPSSPGSFQNMDADEYSGGQLSSYMVMRPGSNTPPTHSISTGGYMDMAAGAYKDMSHSSYSDSSSYMPMNHVRPSSSMPVPIQQGHESPAGYMEMSGHMHLPPVKERGSNEGYLPMSPSFGVSPSSSAGYPHPDHSVCMLLSDDLGDFSHPPTRTYSLGSRPVKTITKFSGYMDMSGRQGVSDNGRSCSAPHLITHHPHQGRSTATSSRTSNMDSPTPSASPLSMSMKSDDSDSFMELDFYRPRTASDSYSYRPRSSSFGLSQSSQVQPHRPRSSSHGQGTRPVRQNRLISSDSNRLSHEMLQRVSLNSSVRGSFDSLKVSSSESLRKLSLEVRAKTSQLSNNDYIDMSFEKRHTPSPQPTKQGGNGYVDMTLGSRKSSPSRVKSTSRSNSKSSSAEKLPESEYTPMSCSSGKDPVHRLLQDPQQQLQGTQGSTYMNLDIPDPGPRRQDPSPQDLENVDSYILCEPAPMVVGGGGSSVVCGSAKMDSGSQDPRNRSGSGGKEQKKKGFFHRHSHRDAAKHSSKRADQTQQSGTSSFECTVSQSGIGAEKVTLGYDIRQKKSGSSRNSNRKSVPFLSRSLDASSSSSKGVQLKKSDTPPRGSLDSMDEYIEFSPMAVKSDSDSSHSSGSAHTPTIPSDNVVAAKVEPDYIGFEPGRIFSSKRSSGGNYMQMGETSNLGTSASFFNTKSKFSNKLKRSKSKDENAAASTLTNPVVATPTTNVSGTQDLGVVPQYIRASQKFSQPTVASSVPQRPHSANITYLTSPSTGFSFSSDMSSHGVCPPSSSSHISQSSGPASSVTMKSSSPSSSSDVFTKNSQAKKMDFLNIDPKRFSDGKGNIADSRKVLEDEPSAVAKAEGGRFGEESSSNVKPQVWDRTVTTQVKSSTTPVEMLVSPAGPALISKPEAATSQTPAAEGVLPSSTKVEQASVSIADLPSSFMCEESASTQEPHLRKMCSSDRGCSLTESVSSACGQVGMGELSDKGSGANTSSADSGSSGASDKLSQGDSCSSCRGGSSGAGTKHKEVKSPGLRPSRSSAPQLDAVFGLMRPDNTLSSKTDAESFTPSLGRGRHSSSTSQAGGGGNNGALPVNPGTSSRHSLTDLSGYEQMSFPSDALSHQQPAHYQVQQQMSPSQQQAPTPGPNGQGILNYVTLDLGSADSVGDGGDSSRSPRNKSRHPSSADEKGESSSYATIDFGKSENLRNSGNKEVKFTL